MSTISRKSELCTSIRLEGQLAQESAAGWGVWYIPCPRCHHKLFAVYDDTSGHIETKCKKCGQVTAFHILNTQPNGYHLN